MKNTFITDIMAYELCIGDELVPAQKFNKIKSCTGICHIYAEYHDDNLLSEISVYGNVSEELLDSFDWNHYGCLKICSDKLAIGNRHWYECNDKQKYFDNGDNTDECYTDIYTDILDKIVYIFDISHIAHGEYNISALEDENKTIYGYRIHLW